MQADLEGVAQRLRQARHERGLTLEQVAHRTRQGKQTVWRHEHGATVSKRAAAAYAPVLGVTTQWILFGFGDGPGDPVQAVLDAYLRMPLGRDCPPDVAECLRRVSFSSLGVKSPTVAAVHRVRELIEFNRLLERRSRNDSAHAAIATTATP